MSGSVASYFRRERLVAFVDGLVPAIAVALPWSTSATGILLVIWLLVLVPTLAWSDVRREMTSPAGGLPVLLVLLGVLGMLWADVSLLERWKGLDSFFKLLVMPLLMIQFRRGGGNNAFIGFLLSCCALLIGSWIITQWPEITWKGSRDAGVLVKGYIVQSAEFTICASVLLYIGIEAASGRRWIQAAASIGLAFAFLANIFFIATSRTTLVVLAVLALLYGARHFRWKGVLTAATAGLVLASALWTYSPYLHDRVTGLWTEIEAYEAQNIRTPTGERIIFWTKSIQFIKSAPLAGNGTGSITEMFRRAAMGETGARAEVASNPHNQTFAVAIQLGLMGAAVLWAMWISHLLLFRGAGLVAWIGLVLVVQNIIGSLFNSFLFDFTEGWIYVVGVGVAAGLVQRKTSSVAPGKADVATTAPRS